MPGGQVTNLRF
jgi:pyruvate carboxylase